MLDSDHSMWLPGFGPDQFTAAPIEAPQKPLAVEVKEYINEKVRKTWPAMRADLWDRAFTPVERFTMNCEALRTAQALKAGQVPDEAQREALNLFTGWGALSKVFSDHAPEWATRKSELEGLLGDQLDSARASVTTSFFTPPAIVSAVWKGIRRLGFKGGKVLEPSAGSGMFLAQMPTDIAKRSTVTAIDLDGSASKILSALYGSYGVKVLNCGFEKASLPADYFDLVVTNVPFGDFPTLESRSVPFRGFRIHDYFFARALETVRPGGLVVGITSSGTLDKVSSTVRRYLATQGELVSASRLPTSAFKAFAGTEPTTDILIFRKYAAGEMATPTEQLGWIESGALNTSDPLFGGTYQSVQQVMMNQWYRSNPKLVLGRLSWARTSGYHSSLVCEDDGSDFLGRLNNQMDNLPSRTYVEPELSRRAGEKQRAIVQNDSGILPGTFIEVEGMLAVSEGAQSVLIEDSTSAKAKERIRGMIELRTITKALIKAQIDSSDEVEPQRLRQELVISYDRFVKSYGPLTNVANTRAFKGDPCAPLLHSLEMVAEDGTVSKAAIFTTRTIGASQAVTKCDSAEDALQVSLAQKGYVEAGLMAALTNTTPENVLDELSCKGAIFRNPDTGGWETADEYLSGDVKTKLSMAELAGSDYAINVAALKEVIPADIAPHDISARLGSTWVPLSVYEAFITETFGCNGQVKVNYEALTGSWNVKCNEHSVGVAQRQLYGTSRVHAIDLLVNAFNQQVPTVTDADPMDSKKRVTNQTETIAAREKLAMIKDRFGEWLWENDDRATAMAGCYNDAFNRIVERQFDGKHLALPGFSNVYTLRTHQKNGVWRIISSKGNTMLAHCVGAGKTLEMICAGQELKRLGLATKPCYVVPNHMLTQFSTDYLRAYPGANILVASKDDLAGSARRRFLTRIATNNWDAVIITHASFERIKMSDKAIKAYVDDQIAQLVAALRIEREDGSRATVKQLERSKRQWEARLEKLTEGKGDNHLDMSFEELGIDFLMCDEAHTWKNLYRFTKMSRVAGLPNSNAEKSFDMLLKTRYVSSRRGWKGGVVFATGTPISNSMGELYTMQNYLAPMTLRANNIAQFDAWAANYGEAVSAIEVSPDGGGYRMNTRFARFTNLPELMAMFREFADIKTRDMLDLPVPATVKETITATPSSNLKIYVDSLVKRAEAIRNGKVDPSTDNMLKITSEGRKAALDMRLVLPGHADEPDNKVNMCIRKVLEIHRETAADRSTQVIFSDLGTPNTDGRFNIYDEIKGKLLAAGVPPHEVAFAHDASTDKAKEALSNDVRKGKVRVILGSTQKLGVGTNMQDRLIALHHLDAPWRPSDIEQREGRIQRQGNTNDSVRIYTYVTSGSFDAYIWQTLESKQRFIGQIMHGETGVRSAEDLELAALSYAEVKALASGNPLVLEKAGIDAEMARLSIMKTQHDRQQWANRREVASLPERIESTRRRMTAAEADLSQRPGSIEFVAAGTTFRDTAIIGAYIEKAVRDNVFRGGPEQVIGKIGHFTVTVRARLLGDDYCISLRGNTLHEASFSGRALSATNAIQRMWQEMAEFSQGLELQIGHMEKTLEGLRAQLSVPFEKAARLAEVAKRQAEIEAEMGIGSSEMAAAEAA